MKPFQVCQIFLFFLSFFAISNGALSIDRPILRIALEQPPVTLNPRMALDAHGQRLGALIFRGLVRINKDLQAEADLAEKWEILNSGKVWKFWIKPHLLDQSGQPIDTDRIRQCLESYRVGLPISPLRASFPSWRGTRNDQKTIFIDLDQSEPYLLKNLSLLRYFRTEDSRPPCSEPNPGQNLIGSGEFKPTLWDLSPQNELILQSPSQELRFYFVRDETTRTLKLLRGEVDVIQNAITLTKTRWLERQHADRFKVLERDGVNVSYLAFNMSDPILKTREVRQAIAEGIFREEIVQNKFFGFGVTAGSFLSPLLPESYSAHFSYNPLHAEQLLDSVGYPRGPDGVRIRLKYKCTPIREGVETALLIKDMLRKIGIELTLELVEPAVFFSTIQKGAFQLFSSRWIGVSDASILSSTLHSNRPQNRIRYQNPEIDTLLDQAMHETNASVRTKIIQEVQKRMAKELPYFPLWFWRNALIIRKDLTGLKAQDLSLSGAFEPLTHLRPIGSKP